MAEKSASEIAVEERAKVTVTTPAKEEVVEPKPEGETETEEVEVEPKPETEEAEGETEEIEEVVAAADDDPKQTIEKLNKTIERLQRRIGKTTGSATALRAELAEAKTALAAKVESGEGLSEADVERISEQKANQKLAEKEFRVAEKRLVDGAKAIDKTFIDKVNEMAAEVSPLPGYMIGILDDLDNGAAVLNHLTDNVDEYETIHVLNPAKMALALSKISDKLAEEKKPKPKPISKVPKPLEAIGGNQSSPQVLSDKMKMDDWVALRNKQAEDYRKSKMR